MAIRDRIVELRRVKAADLVASPKNWRTHPSHQREALEGVLADIGYADALLARQLDDGRLQLIDGHLRAETTPNDDVPVLVLDVTEAEADKLLAVLDPLAGLAGTSESALGELLDGITTEDERLRGFLDQLAQQIDLGKTNAAAPGAELTVPEIYQIVVDCEDESAQRSLYERLVEEGLRCRVLTL
ncbi:MAG: hypothetical protein R3C10_03715 [Pirellulales bacterium]